MSIEEIEVGELARELRGGGGVTLLDVRAEDDFTRWHIACGGSTVVNVPSDSVEGQMERLADLARQGPLNVICTRGLTSQRIAGVLDEHGVAARSVAGGMIAWGRHLTASPVDIGTPTTVVQLRREARGCLSYLIARDGEALVVDPAPDVDAYEGEAARLGATITHILDTHVHADHLSGGRLLSERTGAELHLSRSALARGVHDPERMSPVADGDTIVLGGASVEVVALPGHTSDNTGLLVDGRALVLGDSLFADSVARPDLEVGDEGADEAARQLHGTLHARVLSLPDDTVLLPCHYGGGQIEGPVAPTLGRVRSDLDLLSLPQDEFVRRVLSEMPPRPDNYLTIIAVNLGDSGIDEVERLEVGANNCAAGPGTTTGP